MTLIVPLVFSLIPSEPSILTTSVSGNYTVISTDQRVEITLTSNITITLPIITAAFKNKPSITFVIKGNTGFNATFVGTSSNYTDENFQIGNDPQLESIKIYASDDGTWKKDGYGLQEQQTLYSSLSTGLIKIGTNSDDPTTLITDNGDNTIDTEFDVNYRIVDRVNDANGTPANNQFTKSRSRIFTASPVSNLSHASITDGNVLFLVDNTGAVSAVQLTSGGADLSPHSDVDPDLNTHVHIGGLTKSSGSVEASTLFVEQSINNNIYNRNRNIEQAIGTINSIDNPITISPIAGTIQIATTAGRAFLPGAAGFIQTKGFNPSQFTNTASSPTTILTVDRVGDGNIVNVSTSLNVNEFESTPGTFTAKGANKASVNKIIAFSTFNVELLGEVTYSGGSRLTDALAANESVNNPGISSAGAKIQEIAIDNGATDLTLVAEAIFKDLKQFN